MKTFTSLLIGCALALAGAAWAQQPDEQSSPTKNKHGKEKTETAEPNAGANTANPHGNATTKQRGDAKAERRAARTQNAETAPNAASSTNADANGRQGRKGRHERDANAQSPPGPASETTTGADAKVSGQTGVTTDVRQDRRGKHGRDANAQTPPGPTSEKTTGVDAKVSSQTSTGVTTDVQRDRRGKHERDANAQALPNQNPATTTTTTGASVATEENARVRGEGKAKRLDAQKTEQIRTQHASFKAQARPDRVPTVTYNQNYRIQNSDHWQGPQYEVFRSYHPERHDPGWYHSHYNRVEQIGGGYYYFNNGYWYPAWGYSPSAEYYAYDGPIYVGHRSLPPDQVIADVQATLQEMGYYRGEVDGLLGPLTREALTSYQADQGLTPTAAIDEPTLDSLGMG